MGRKGCNSKVNEIQSVYLNLNLQILYSYIFLNFANVIFIKFVNLQATTGVGLDGLLFERGFF